MVNAAVCKTVMHRFNSGPSLTSYAQEVLPYTIYKIYSIISILAGMMKLVDIRDLNSLGASRAGSSPAPGTIFLTSVHVGCLSGKIVYEQLKISLLD